MLPKEVSEFECGTGRASTVKEYAFRYVRPRDGPRDYPILHVLSHAWQDIGKRGHNRGRGSLLIAPPYH